MKCRRRQRGERRKENCIGRLSPSKKVHLKPPGGARGEERKGEKGGFSFLTGGIDIYDDNDDDYVDDDDKGDDGEED